MWVAMTDFLDCLRGQIPDDIFKKVEAAYNASQKSKRKRFSGKQADAEAAAEVGEHFAGEIKKDIDIKALAAQRSLDLWNEIQTQRGNRSSDAYYGEIILERVASTAEYNRGLSVQVLNDFLREVGPRAGVFRPKNQVRDMQNLVREIMGQSSGDENAKAFANAYAKANDWLIDQINENGGSINKRQRRQFGQNHDSELIRQASFDEWWGDLKPRLAVDDMIDSRTGQPFEDADLDGLAREIHQKITTGVSSEQLDRLESGQGAIYKKTKVEKKFSHSRFFIFKDADSFFEYNERFGSGNENLYNSMINEISGMSETLGVLQELGPRPEDTHNYIMQRLSADDSRNTNAWSAYRKNQLDGAFKLLTNQDHAIDKPSIGVEMYGTARGLFTASKLGSAALLAPADSVYTGLALNARGFSGIRAIQKYISGLNPASASNRLWAENLALAGDVLTNRMISAGRHVGDEFIGKSKAATFAQKAGTFTIENSGLRFLTDNAKRATGIEFYGQLGAWIKSEIPWEKLDADFRNAAKEFNITKSDWGKILKLPTSPLDDAGKTAFLMPHEIKDLDIGRKLGSFGYKMMRLAANEPSVMLRSVRTGFGSPRGSIGRLAASDLLYLKTFAASVLMNHFIPAVRRSYSGVRAGDITKLDSLAMLVVGSTLVGTMTSQLREIVNGRDAGDWSDPKTYVKGVLNAGGLSIFGDFLFADYARTGASFGELLSPWVAQNLGRTLDVFQGDIGRTLDEDQEGNIPRSLYRFMKDFVPAQNLWYSRLTTDRLLFDNIERLLDPNFESNVRRRESRTRRETGQGYWWGRGDLGPERAPIVTEGLPVQ